MFVCAGLARSVNMAARLQKDDWTTPQLCFLGMGFVVK